ncbi:hypothetical protein V1525DRAFT_392353 [Lipomyces kononenkoae]|uniref:Uncharacterized protein n=1 Tax=Lipomyces kononenkoae TaxID=34357 RepID=A0ACC3TBM8_LIPKO
MSDSELLNQIAILAGAINRHKNNGQQTPSTTSSSYPSRTAAPRSRSAYRGIRGRGRASSYRGVKSISHRHRTLVLNGSSISEPVVDSTDSSLSTGVPSSTTNTPTNSTGPTYVKKRDRHMQLINSSVYSDLAQARTKAIEATRVAKEKKLEEKLVRRAQREAAKARRVARLQEVEIDGVKYRVAKDGSKLIRVTADEPNASHAPKKAIVGGVTFLRSKNGNLWRKGFVKSKKLERKSIDEPCRYFTMTGKCGRGLSCPYNHDPNHVALCPLYLHNKCQNPSCDLSHTPSPHNSPLCVHFQRGHCSNPNCKYTHMTVAPDAKVCRDFALKLYCDAGDKCTGRHVFECPDFEESGTCPRGEKRCKLMHVFRAGKNKQRNDNPREDSDGMVFMEDGGNGKHSELPADVLQNVIAHLQRDEELSTNHHIFNLYSDDEEDGEEDENDDGDEDEDEDDGEDDVEFDSDMFEDDDDDNNTGQYGEGDKNGIPDSLDDDGGQEYIPL